MFQHQSVGIDSGVHCQMFISYQAAHGPGWASRILLGVCMWSTDLGARRELAVNHQVTERRESKSLYRETNELLWGLPWWHSG